MLQVCQPLAITPPKIEAAPASWSTWNGCGSNCVAKAMISSSLTVRLPSAISWPGKKSSKYQLVLLHAAAVLGKSRLRHEAPQVMVGVAQRQFDHGQALEVVRGRQFVGHAHAAVQLDRLLADELHRLADPELGGRHRAPALVGVARRQLDGGQQGHRARLLEVDEHVGHAVLQRLEFADRRAELGARLQVFEGGGEDRFHHAERFGAQQAGAVVGRRVEDVPAGARRADQRRCRRAHIVERDVGGALAVERAVAGDA